MGLLAKLISRFTRSKIFVQTNWLPVFCKPMSNNIENANNIIRREFSMDITDLCADEMKSLIPSLKTSVAGGSCRNLEARNRST